MEEIEKLSDAPCQAFFFKASMGILDSGSQPDVMGDCIYKYVGVTVLKNLSPLFLPLDSVGTDRL